MDIFNFALNIFSCSLFFYYWHFCLHPQYFRLQCLFLLSTFWTLPSTFLAAVPFFIIDMFGFALDIFGCSLSFFTIDNFGFALDIFGCSNIFFYNVQFQKISILPPRKVFCFALPPGNSSLFSYICSKYLAFKTPLPLGISNDLPWGGYGFFLELHNEHFWLQSFFSYRHFWLRPPHFWLQSRVKPKVSIVKKNDCCWKCPGWSPKCRH